MPKVPPRIAHAIEALALSPNDQVLKIGAPDRIRLLDMPLRAGLT